MTAKEMLERVKAAYNAIVTPVAPAAAAAPAPTPAPPKTYKLQDGSEISITQAGEVPAIGDSVMVGGVPAIEGVLTLEDGSTITVDATGKISAVAPAAPVTNDLSTAPAAPKTIEIPKTAEELQKLTASFANGTPEERITNLEIVAKALMENCFGWQIQEAQRKATADQAIEVYKTELTNAQAKLSAHTDITNQLIQLCTQLAETPTADPATLTGTKKERFEKSNKREEKMEQIAAAISKLKTPQTV
jgi:hypothetical protein